MAQVQWSYVDGVPVAWVPSDSAELSAALMFRVGKADEALYFNGITHFIEHLALFALGRPPHAINGSVGATVTTFTTHGSPSEVVQFFAGLCRSLQDLPLDRMQAEARILATEHTRRGGPYDQHMFWRYGCSGPGLSHQDEFATRSLSGAQLQGWVQQRMTTQNAVLVLSGPVPQGLRLELPQGNRLAVPPLNPVPTYFPRWFRARGGGATFSGVVERSAPLSAMLYCLNESMIEQLRTQSAVAYSPQVDADPYDASHGHVFGDADAHPDFAYRALSSMGKIITDLARSGPSHDLLARYRQAAQVEPPGAEVGLAMWEARQHLLCAPHVPAAEHRELMLSASAEQVRALAEQLATSTLYGVPEGCRLDDGFARPVDEVYTGPVIPGQKVMPVFNWPATVELFESPGALTMRHERGATVSVAFQQVVGVLAWPDGARQLINRDGSSLTVEPTLWDEGSRIVAEVDAATKTVQVPMQPRAYEDIPRPRRTETMTVAQEVAHAQTKRLAFGRPRSLKAQVISAGVGSLGSWALLHPDPTTNTAWVAFLALAGWGSFALGCVRRR